MDVHLYGSLYYKKQDVSLYYYFEPRVQRHEIRLTPIAIEDDALEIRGVELQGRRFRHFDARQRTLVIPPGVGGTFKVTFSRASECD